MNHHNIVVFTFGWNALNFRAGKYHVGVPSSVRNKEAYLLLSKTMTGELSDSRHLQAVHIYSNVQTRAKLLCIMLMVIMSDVCVVTAQ